MAGESNLVGRVFGGRYRVTGLVGEGGMANVYRAQAPDGSELAIKVMGNDLTKSEVFVKRFLREAKTAASLRHRSTVRIHDFGVDDETPFIAMELVEGAELARLLHHEGRFPETRAVRILAQVCSALAAAHDLGIVHRDLKPENIMVVRDPAEPSAERVKVLDFGIAKIMSPEMVSEDSLPVESEQRMFSSNVPELTTMGTLVGTPDYMAPEQLRGEAVDARTDLYACGLILYQMLTGAVPLAGETWIETMRIRNASPARKLSESIPGTDERLDALVASTLELDRTLRPVGARQMQERLLALLPDLTNVVLPMAQPKAPPKGGTVRMAPAAVTLPTVSAASPPSPKREAAAAQEAPPSKQAEPDSLPGVASDPTSSAQTKVRDLGDRTAAETLPREVPSNIVVRAPIRIPGAEITLASPKSDEATVATVHSRPTKLKSPWTWLFLVAVLVVLGILGITLLGR